MLFVDYFVVLMALSNGFGCSMTGRLLFPVEPLITWQESKVPIIQLRILPEEEYFFPCLPLLHHFMHLLRLEYQLIRHRHIHEQIGFWLPILRIDLINQTIMTTKELLVFTHLYHIFLLSTTIIGNVPVIMIWSLTTKIVLQNYFLTYHCLFFFLTYTYFVITFSSTVKNILSNWGKLKQILICRSLSLNVYIKLIN